MQISATLYSFVSQISFSQKKRMLFLSLMKFDEIQWSLTLFDGLNLIFLDEPSLIKIVEMN